MIRSFLRRYLGIEEMKLRLDRLEKKIAHPLVHVEVPPATESQIKDAYNRVQADALPFGVFK